jgi:hypothetical protein
MFKKGLVIATAVAGAMLLAGCASQGSGSACGEPTAVPVAAPAPMNTCKNMSSCKHKMKHHRHHHHHAVAKKEVSKTSTTTTSTESTPSN